MKFSNIENNDKYYNALRWYADFLHNKIFYKKPIILGLENIPKNEPIIFTPNHQNALMDAMIVLCTKKWAPIFLARADIFKNPRLAKLLYFFKILPIFRMRDGKETLKNNDAVFDKTIEILRKNKILVIYPEANHAGFRRLRQLKKGVARIAFQAEELNNFNLGVKVIPVGINYQDYYSIQKSILIHYGKPIALKDYIEQYTQNPQRTLNDFTNNLHQNLKKLVIHINEVDTYEQMLIGLELFVPLYLKSQNKPTDYANWYKGAQQVLELIYEKKEQSEQFYEQLIGNLTDIHIRLQKSNVTLTELVKPLSIGQSIVRILLTITLLPFYLFGAINNFIPFFIPSLLTRKFPDKNFHTSVRYALYLVLFPVFYGIIMLVLALVGLKWWLLIVYLLLMPITGLLAVHYVRNFKRVYLHFVYLFHKNSDNILQIKSRLASIKNIFQTLLND